MANLPTASAKNETGDFDPAFTDFVRRILSVPHSQIKVKLDAEKKAKRISKASVSRVPASSSTRVV